MGMAGFVQGVKISGVNPSALVLDTGRTGRWHSGDSAFIATIAYNTTGTVYTVIPFVAAESIGGTTMERFQLSLRHGASGEPVSWTSAVAGSGQVIDIMVFGFLK
jgi:hypothetical protein